MICINPQFDRSKKERGDIIGTEQELFPHLYNAQGERVEEFYLYIDEEHGDLIVECITTNTDEIRRAVKKYAEKEKETCKTWLARLTKRLAILEAIDN